MEKISYLFTEIKKAPIVEERPYLFPNLLQRSTFMRNKSIGHKQLISQCLSVLPTDSFSCPLLNYGYDKLSVDALLKVFVAAQLDDWQSYEEMEEKLRANPEFCQSINLPGIRSEERRVGKECRTRWRAL